MVTTTERSAFVRASPPNVTDGLVISYIMSYQAVGMSNVVMMNFTADDTLLNVTIQPLLPFTNYVFSVRACTIIGCSPVSANVMVMTLEDGNVTITVLCCEYVLHIYIYISTNVGVSLTYMMILLVLIAVLLAITCYVYFVKDSLQFLLLL